ncbi:MAG: laccase domain-containing protein, partial [Bdellovibrionota bacterium]
MSNPFRKFAPHPLGAAFVGTDVTAFFGDRRSTAEALAFTYPDFKFISLKQTHSDIVVRTPFGDVIPEADAHVTNEKHLALAIRTADCVPVLIHD